MAITKNHLIPEGFTNTFEEVQSILSSLKASHFRFFEKNQPILYQSMIDHTSFLPEDVTIQERKYCILNDIRSLPTCKVCDNPVQFDRRGPNYKTYCSRTCTGKDIELREKRKQTNLERYGVEVTSQHPDVIAKAKQTNLERYGYTSILADIEYRKKCMMDKYGYEFPMQNPELSKKVQKFRAEHMEEIIETTKKNSREKWGCDFPVMHPLVQQKFKATNKERYGAENPFQSKVVMDQPEVISKRKSTNLEKFGHETFVKSDYFKENVDFHTKSLAEQEVADFIQNDLGLQIVQSDRMLLPSGKELDIYIPAKNMAIEYCGLYWHSETFKNTNDHKSKFDEAKEQGIQLITVFDDEWQYQKEQVKLRLSTLMNCNQSNPVYARKCSIREIDKNDAYELLDTYHLQGRVNASVYLGLVYDGELVSVMTFVRRNDNDYELNRFVSKCMVPGGFSKLLTYFKRNYVYDTIYSFADCRWSWGEVYTRNGFTLKSTIKPDYYYTDGKKRFHKFLFRKKSIERKFGIDMTNKTEREAMKELGFKRIYDCGKYKFMLESESK